MKLHRFFLTTCLLALAACGALAAAETEPAVPFVSLATGNKSGCTKRALMTIENEAEWHRVWKLHSNSDAEPQKVDFERQSVVALLAGSQPNQKLIEISEIVASPRETVIFYVLADQDLSWERALAAGGSQPFHFALIDKPKLPVRFVDALVGDTRCSKCPVK